MERRELCGRAARLRPLLVLALALGLAASASYLFFHRLGEAPLVGDEAIHALVARESAARERWLPPTYDGGAYLAKPPLKILAVAWIFRRFGVSELHARVLDAAFGVATVLLVFLFGTLTRGPWTGALAGLLLATAPLYVFRHGVREGVQDAALVFLLAAVVTLHFLYLEGGRRRRLLLAGAGVAAGLAALVKGAAALLALPVVAAWAVAGGRRPGERRWAAGRDVLAVAALAAAFYLPYLLAAVEWSGGRFFSMLHRDVVVRAVASVDPTHVHGPWFYLRQLGEDFGPWLVAALPALAVAGAWWRGGAPARARVVGFTGLWAATLLAVLSLSRSKLPWYPYPAYPAIALLLACGAGDAVRWVARRVRPAGLGLALAASIAGLALLGVRERFEQVRVRLEEEPQVLPARHYAEALGELPSARLAISRRARLQPWDLFYLGPLGGRTWKLPRWVRVETPGTCRFLVHRRPDVPPAAAPAPRAQVYPLGGPAPVRAWLLDLDGCFPPWV